MLRNLLLCHPQKVLITYNIIQIQYNLKFWKCSFKYPETSFQERGNTEKLYIFLVLLKEIITTVCFRESGCHSSRLPRLLGQLRGTYCTFLLGILTKHSSALLGKHQGSELFFVKSWSSISQLQLWNTCLSYTKTFFQTQPNVWVCVQIQHSWTSAYSAEY